MREMETGWKIHSSEYYQTIFENAYDAIFIESLSGQILDVNPAACSLTGYTREELLTMNVSQLLPPNDQLRILTVMRQEFEKGSSSFSGVNLRKDGSRVPVEVRMNSFCNNGLEGLIVIVRDITEREETAKQEARQRVILESLHDLAVGLLQRHELQEVITSILQHVCQLFETEDSYFYMLAQEPGMIEIKAGCGNYVDKIGYKRRIGTGLSGTVWATGEAKAVEDYQQWEGKDTSADWQSVRASAGIPLKSNGQVIGVIGLDLNKQNRILPMDFMTFRRLADLASVAIDNVLLWKNVKESQEQFHSLYSNMAEGVALHESVFDESGRLVNYRIVDVNPKFSEILGFTREAVLGKLATEIYKTKEVPYLEEFSKAVYQKESRYFEVCFAPLNKHFAIFAVPWKENGFASIFSDISERKQAEQKLVYMSYHDALTGVYNRAFFASQLQVTAKSKKAAALLVADIDGLKSANDMFGHEEGDQLLIRAANFLRENLRPSDMLARIGGDEFAVIMENTDAEQAAEICRRLRKRLEKAAEESTHAFPLQMSLGFAMFSDSANAPEEVFRAADNKMYMDKMQRRIQARASIRQTIKDMLGECDYWAEGHADRMTERMLQMARAVGMPEKHLELIELFAQFHDIGKVGLADSILHKPQGLSPEEQLEMRQHCEIGHRIAQALKELFPIADWILKHHEHWDGKGYPLGLKGEEIPLECRILAIVDAYDAMTNERPYRSTRSREEALQEIERCAGTQFDPALVPIFTDVLSSSSEGKGKR